MSQNLIETVAQAMHGNRYEWPRPEFAEHRQDYREMAQEGILAFLEAIREPSEKIGRVMWERYQGDPEECDVVALRGAFTAAIDALRADIENAP
jgi:hypothetical protein